MISIQAEEQASCGCGCTGVAGDIFEIGAEAARVSRILDFAEPWQVNYFKLRKPLGHYKAGEFIDRITLEHLLFKAPYAKVAVQGKPADLAAVESPNIEREQ